MIIVKCPKCERKLSVEDAKAGGVSACPDCGQRFRIPQTGPRTPEKLSPKQAKGAPSQRKPASAAKSASAPKPPRRPGDSWMYEDSSPYAVTPEAEPAPAPKKRRLPSSDNDDDLDPATYSFD